MYRYKKKYQDKQVKLLRIVNMFTYSIYKKTPPNNNTLNLHSKMNIS